MPIFPLQRLKCDDRGAVVAVETIFVATVALLGLLAGLTSVRDAVTSEISDVAGAVQDNTLCYMVTGIQTHSASVPGMSFDDRLDACDSAGDLVGATDNCIVLNVLPADEGDGSVTFESLSFGHELGPDARSIDGWRSIMLIDESQTYTSTATDTVTAIATTFGFNAGRVGGVVTPFIVKVSGDNDFEVIAVGDTVNVTSLGEQTHAFSSGTTTFELGPGETLAFGFLDANADGSGSNASVVRYNNGGSETWISGGLSDVHSGSVAVGAAPSPGRTTRQDLRRSYQFNIGIDVPE